MRSDLCVRNITLAACGERVGKRERGAQFEGHPVQRREDEGRQRHQDPEGPASEGSTTSLMPSLLFLIGR